MSRYPELGAAFGAIHTNLEELDARQNRLLECRLAHLDEWAETALRVSGDERDTLLQLLDTLRSDREFVPSTDVPPENREELRHFYRYVSVPERLCILRAVTRRSTSALLNPPDGISSDTEEEPPDVSENARDKIAYVQNTFSDTAYLHFSRTLERPRAAYFDSFSGVCEEVYNGICEYCILPILHERDGKLFRFYALLEKYDLKIVSACDVPWVEKEGTAVTRYALIRRNLPASVYESRPPAYLELKLPTDDAVSLCDLLQVARLCRLIPERVDTRADAEIPDLLAHHITFRLSDADIRTFLVFLTLDVPRGTVLGLYRVLDTPS